MKKYFFILIPIFIIGFSFVFAQQDDPFADIVYPVPELGNCQNKGDCESYCDKPENMAPCLDFAEEHNLISEEDIEMGKKMLAAGETSGPGGCRGVAECGEYCDDISHIKECVAFAEEHDMMSEDELAEAKKVVEALERGLTPPNNCKSKEECGVYCSQPENMAECITFAKEAGLMPPEELEEAEKVLAAIEKGVIPPPCGSKDKCDAYCSAPEHLDECITFAEAAGFMSPEEAEMVKRTGGKGPGNCQGKDACEAYCEDPAHGEECVNFAEEFGFMSPEEAEMARKMMASGMGLGGPGGCKGRDECDAYCEDFTHMEECVDFAEKAGFMSSEDAERARRMAEKGINMMQGGPGGCKGQEECEVFCNDPANMETCLDFAVQIGDVSPEDAEQARESMQMRAQMEECLEMPCEEALACFESLSSDQPPAEGEELPEQGGGGENDEIQAKIESCIQEMGEGMMPPEGFKEGFEEGFEGEIPEGFEEQFRQQGRPSTEEIEKMMQEQMEQEIQRQMQQKSSQQEIGVSEEFCLQNPTDPLCPGYKQAPISPGYCAENPTDPLCQQSFFERIRIFLAGLVPNL